ncbi:MAG TPA: hypothetical protein VG367_19360 [Mucilaginibacter sp.]|jgi:hypothetical protein|nr:hypothetical protein [Mucilaginibacter sp.]
MNKLYLIIITSAQNVNIHDLITVLGYGELIPVKNIDLYDSGVIYGLSLGAYHDKVLISDHNRIFDFFGEGVLQYEQKLYDLFPQSEIVVLNLYSVIDGYGYSIIRDGKRKRIKHGSHEAVYYDFGEKTIEEIVVDEEYPVDDSHAGRLTVEYLLEKYLGNEKGWGDVKLVQYK